MSPLYTKLQEIGGVLACLSGSKLKNILQLSCCILKTRSCNLQKCRDELSSVTGEQDLKQDTAYARLKRVFQTGLIDPALKAIFLFILYLLHPREQALLVVDRTDFQIGGRFWANLLVFGLVWKGVFIPLVWRDLGQRGNSSQQDRIQLLDRLLAWWKASGLELPLFCLTADREFTGQDWLMDLEQRGLEYVIRIKSNLRFQVWHNGQLKDHGMSLKTLARYMMKYQRSKMEVILKGTIVTNVMRLPQEDPKDKEPFVLLITNLEDWQLCQSIFRQRWPIECCFKHLKSNGFDLEDIHLEGKHKTELLFGMITLVYVLAVYQGNINGYEQQVKWKQYPKAKVYRQQSLFRFGLYQLKQIVRSLDQFVDFLYQLVMNISQKFILINYGVQP